METVIWILFYLLVGGYELYPLYQERRWKQGIIYLSLFSISFVLVILLSIGVKIPSPAGPIEDAVEKIIGLF